MEIIRYDKARDSLIEGLRVLREKLDELDIDDPDIRPRVNKLLAQTREVIRIAREKRTRENEPYLDGEDEVRARWDSLLEDFSEEENRLMLFQVRLDHPNGVSWKWRVVDKDQVPDRYCTRYVDGDAVDFAIKNGIMNIPGIRIYNEEGGK